MPADNLTKTSAPPTVVPTVDKAAAEKTQATIAAGTIETPIYGKVTLSKAIYEKWQSTAEQETPDGCTVKEVLGLPLRDSFKLHSGDEAAYFEGGMIVSRLSRKAWVVYGAIYLHYRELNDVASELGLPIADEEPADGYGRRSRFDHGEIYLRKGNGAHAIHGAIRNRWYHCGGPGGILGYPTTGELAVIKDRKAIGASQRFSGGAVIYWSNDTGAWEIRGPIRKMWEHYGGATGWLGFPTSGETETSAKNGKYNNFQNGCLVWRKAEDKVYAFGKAEFYLDRFDSKGDDGILAGAQDVYVHVDVSASTGQAYKQRMPPTGNLGKGAEIQTS